MLRSLEAATAEPNWKGELHGLRILVACFLGYSYHRDLPQLGEVEFEIDLRIRADSCLGLCSHKSVRGKRDKRSPSAIICRFCGQYILLLITGAGSGEEILLPSESLSCRWSRCDVQLL